MIVVGWQMFENASVLKRYPQEIGAIFLCMRGADVVCVDGRNQGLVIMTRF